MTVDRVDIKPLNTLYFENLLGLQPDEQAKMFEGSDLVLDKANGALKRIVSGQAENSSEVVTIEQEVEYVRLLRGSDANGDGSLNLAEIRLMLQSALSEEQAAQVDPQAFLDAVAVLMEKRYAPISQNVKQFRGALAFRPTLDALEIYNHGLYLDDMLQSNAVFSPSRVGKTVTNSLLFVPKLGIKIFDHDTSLLQGDSWAEQRAKSDYDSRQKSLAKLKKVIEEGVEKELPWALEGDLKGALASPELSESDRENLAERMVAGDIHRILNLEDPKERYLQLQSFAVRERPGFLGFGGGNASGWNFWNLSGKHNNLYFAKSALAFLLSKAVTGDTEFDNTMRLDSRNVRKDMLGGQNAGFNNIFSVGLTGVGCGIGYVFTLGQKVNMDTCVTDYQPWGDEERLTSFGRAVEIGLITTGGMRFLTRAGQFNQLRKMEGWRSAGRAWWTGVKQTKWARSFPVLGWNLFGGKHLATTAANAQEALAVAETVAATRLGRMFQTIGGGIGLVWRGVTWPARIVFRGMGKAWKGFTDKLPPLSPEAKVMLDKAAKVGKKLPWWVKGTLVTSAAISIDARTQAYYNPYELDQEANFDRYPDPTKPPQLK